MNCSSRSAPKTPFFIRSLKVESVGEQARLLAGRGALHDQVDDQRVVLADLLGGVADGLEDVRLGPLLGAELLVLAVDRRTDTWSLGTPPTALSVSRPAMVSGVLVGRRPRLDLLVGERADADDDGIGLGSWGCLVVGAGRARPGTGRAAAASVPSRNSRIIVMGPFVSPEGGWTSPVWRCVLVGGRGQAGESGCGVRPIDDHAPIVPILRPPSTHFTPSTGRA